MAKKKMWQVVAPTPKMINVVMPDGTVEHQARSKDSEPFQPVIDRLFTEHRKHGYVQPVMIEIDDDNPPLVTKVVEKEEPEAKPLEAEPEPVVVDAEPVKTVDEIDSLDINDRLKGLLREVGLVTIEELKATSDEDLESVDGLGARSVEKIRKAIEKLEA